jgi:hypothetical protein
MILHLSPNQIACVKRALEEAIKAVQARGAGGTVYEAQFKELQAELNDQAPGVTPWTT